MIVRGEAKMRFKLTNDDVDQLMMRCPKKWCAPLCKRSTGGEMYGRPIIPFHRKLKKR